MIIFGREIAGRVLVAVLAIIVAVIVVSFGTYACDKRRSQAAQSRVEHSQAEAASNSASDAVNTVARSGESEKASEDLTRSNEKEIRNAEGAKDRVGSGVDLAGRRALCLRDAYRDRPECRMFKAPAR